jgi:hypothetical protein
MGGPAPFVEKKFHGRPYVRPYPSRGIRTVPYSGDVLFLSFPNISVPVRTDGYLL